MQGERIEAAIFALFRTFSLGVFPVFAAAGKKKKRSTVQSLLSLITALTKNNKTKHKKRTVNQRERPKPRNENPQTGIRPLFINLDDMTD